MNETFVTDHVYLTVMAGQPGCLLNGFQSDRRENKERMRFIYKSLPFVQSSKPCFKFCGSTLFIIVKSIFSEKCHSGK